MRAARDEQSDRVPVRRLELASHDGRRVTVAVLQHLQQVLAPFGIQHLESKYVEDQDLGLRQAAEQLEVAPVGPRACASSSRRRESGGTPPSAPRSTPSGQVRTPPATTRRSSRRCSTGYYTTST